MSASYFIHVLFGPTIPILASSIYFFRADDQATARIPGYSVAVEGCGLKLVGYEAMAVTLYKVQEIAKCSYSTINQFSSPKCECSTMAIP